MKRIFFFNADIQARIENKYWIRILIQNLFKAEHTKFEKINYVLCTDHYLLQLNKKYLNHETLTDVITFPLSEIGEPMIAEIYISMERVKENAKKFKVQYQTELLRVMIHGALHLCGYADKKAFEREKMRQKEDNYLKKFKVPREAYN
ncbi:MAG: rRNA maturation RNase YbeY [Parafilimonas sp.]